MQERIPSSSELVRRVDELKVPFEVLVEDGRFRVIRVAKPFFQGSEYWVINEKGFLWEPCASEDDALAYLVSEEALDYHGR